MIHLSANTIVILNVYCKLTTMFQTNLTFYFFFFSIILSLPIYENYHAMFLNCFFHWLTIVYVKPGIVVCSCRKIIKICNWHICEKLIMKYLFMPSYICILYFVQEKHAREIVLKAMGQAISKPVAIAEILKVIFLCKIFLSCSYIFLKFFYANDCLAYVSDRRAVPMKIANNFKRNSNNDSIIGELSGQ